MLSAYMKALFDLAQSDGRVAAISDDNGTDLDKWFIREMPKQYFDLGIAECNAVAVAAGFADNGKIPFIHTNSAFLAYRAFEFIRDDVCYQRKNVKLVGSGCGLSIGTLGPTHNATEDIGVLRTLPGLRILSPFNADGVEACVREAYRTDGPTYIRIGMQDEIGRDVALTEKEYTSNIVLRAGDDIAVFVTGSVLKEALEAANELESKGISAQIVYVAELKPFGSDLVARCGANRKLIVTVEEHNVIGGLGTVVAEAIVREGLHKRLLNIGLNDRFSEGYGLTRDLRRMNGVDAASIARKIAGEYDSHVE